MASPCRAARWSRTASRPKPLPNRLFNAGASGVVVKAQIHAGGRGKGGGVKIAKSVEEAGEIASKMLGMTLITHQTGPEGRVVRCLLIEETLPIERELYLGIVIDRAEAKPVFMASAAGGMEIEQVAEENPDAILKEYIIRHGPRRLSGAQVGVSTWTQARAGQSGREVHDRPLQGFRGNRRLADGNQSLHYHQTAACLLSTPR